MEKIKQILKSNNISAYLRSYLSGYNLFSGFQFGLRSSQLTAYLLKVVPARIAGTFSRFVASWAIALDLSKALKACHADLCH